MIRLAAYVVALAALAGCAGTDAAAPDERPFVEPRNAGVAIQLPEGWHVLNADDGHLTDPRTRIAIASGPLRAGGPCDTQVTRYAPDGQNVALVVFEWASVDGAPPAARPAAFDADALPLHPGELECFAGPGGAVQFTEHGRVLGAYVLAGKQASDELVADVRAALETLRVDRRTTDPR